ncbi:phospholipase effector Tle1 domain-containing protein, partial [Pseudomonas aeruginosa]
RSLPRFRLAAAQDTDAPRQLLVCIDGTSNRFGDQPTNVVRLYRSLSRDPRGSLLPLEQGFFQAERADAMVVVGQRPTRIA